MMGEIFNSDDCYSCAFLDGDDWRCTAGEGQCPKAQDDDLISRQAAIHAMAKQSVVDKTVAKRVLAQLPSAEPKWVPVSEKLPEDEGWYLVTDNSGGVLWLEVEHYDPEFGLEPFCTIQSPVAWIALPEPYREGRVLDD